MPEGDSRFWGLVSELKALGMSKMSISEVLGLAAGQADCTANFTAVATGRSGQCTLSEALEALEEELKKRHRAAPQQAAPTKPSAGGGGDDRDGAASAIPVSETSKAASPTPPKKQKKDNDDEEDEEDEAPVSDKEAAFAEAVADAVGKFGIKHQVPKYSKLSAPKKLLSLSRWYHVVKSQGAFPFASQPKLKEDQKARAMLLGEEVRRVYDVTESRVSLWMFDGAGNVVFQLLRFLLKEWTPAELDARLELALVDWNIAMNDYHEWAIPCAKVLRGSIHHIIAKPKIVDAKNPPALPHVAYFNYSITTTSGTKKAEYEVGSWPGSRYSAVDCMTDTAASCKKLLKAFPSAGLVVGFSTVRGAKANGEKFRAATANAELEVKEYPTNRAAFATWIAKAQ